MTEKPKPTYAQLNPRVVLVSGGVKLSKPIKFNIFNDDGTQPEHKRHTNAELADIVKAMFDTLPEDMEMRTLLQVLEGISGLVEGAAYQTLTHMNLLVHDEEATGHLEHELMCPAVSNYLMHYFDHEPTTTEADGATMLDQFLTAGKKPH